MDLLTRENIQNYTEDPGENSDRNYSKTTNNYRKN